MYMRSICIVIVAKDKIARSRTHSRSAHKIPSSFGEMSLRKIYFSDISLLRLPTFNWDDFCERKSWAQARLASFILGNA